MTLLKKSLIQLSARLNAAHPVQRRQAKQFRAIAENGTKRAVPEDVTVRQAVRGSRYGRRGEVMYLSVSDAHFLIGGLPFCGQSRTIYGRLPESLLRRGLRPDLEKMGRCPAGGYLRFTTDSKNIDIRMTLLDIMEFPHMPPTGATGADVYVGNGEGLFWYGCFTPEKLLPAAIRIDMAFQTSEKRDIYVYFPLFAEIGHIVVGLDSDAVLFTPGRENPQKPIAVYGSSITQGCACSRAGLAYTALLSRMLETDVYNFGFSGAARGEPFLARLLAGLDISALVMEYDHNASVDELMRTHETFYRMIRKRQPGLPIVLLSRLSGGLSVPRQEASDRSAIIRKTFESAVARGDRNIYFIDGGSALPDVTRSDFFVDGKHPNDRGMAAIASLLFEILARIEDKVPPARVQ
ncbi:SGNH/GDSL hydrolase family protein [Oscillospiraceae bacterium WX1]